MEIVIKKLKEISSIKEKLCDNQCFQCPLIKIIKEINYGCDYEELDICEILDLINKVL